MKKKVISDEPITDLRKLKGQITRERLVIEAIHLFGNNGYKGTNTRALACAAECNLGLITFHFGGKQGLYAAALERVKLHMSKVTSPAYMAFEENLNMDISPAELFVRTNKVLSDFLHSLLGMEEIAGHALLLLRDSHEKKNLANAEYKEVFLPFISLLEKSLDKATSYKNPLQARLSSFFVINAIVGFLCDYPIFFDKIFDDNVGQPDITYFANIISDYVLKSYNENV